LNLRARGITKHYCSRVCKGASEQAVFPDSLISEYLQGESSLTLASKYKVSGKTIISYLRAKGVPIRSRFDWLQTTPSRNPTKGKGHSEEAKEKIRVANRCQFLVPGARERHSQLQRLVMVEGRVKKTSKVEDKVAHFLDSLGLQYRRWVGIRDPSSGKYLACVDFMVGPIVLEVQGDYWHANPNVYPQGPKYASQIKTRLNDARKLVFLTSLGIKVAYVWELDIKLHGIEAVRKALALCT
jgi:G:T-mismatch repair DNA endonuclease (very short patch repair protein)